MLHTKMYQRNFLSFVHFQSHGSVFSFQQVFLVAGIRSEANTGMSFLIMWPCGVIKCYSCELVFGDEGELYKQKALRSSLKHCCIRRGLGTRCLAAITASSGSVVCCQVIWSKGPGLLSLGISVFSLSCDACAVLWA